MFVNSNDNASRLAFEIKITLLLTSNSSCRVLSYLYHLKHALRCGAFSLQHGTVSWPGIVYNRWIVLSCMNRAWTWPMSPVSLGQTGGLSATFLVQLIECMVQWSSTTWTIAFVCRLPIPLDLRWDCLCSWKIMFIWDTAVLLKFKWLWLEIYVDLCLRKSD